MFERFTDRARRVVVLAQDEARALNHNYIGTEHLLLGLIHEGEGVAAKALESMDISLDAVRAQVVEIIGEGQAAPSGHIPSIYVLLMPTIFPPCQDVQNIRRLFHYIVRFQPLLFYGFTCLGPCHHGIFHTGIVRAK